MSADLRAMVWILVGCILKLLYPCKGLVLFTSPDQKNYLLISSRRDRLSGLLNQTKCLLLNFSVLALICI